MSVDTSNLTIIFSGDSGNGMQHIGNLFTLHMALIGYNISGIPDYPAEIRAPAGSINGVSSYKSIVSENKAVSKDGLADVLIAMNPAAFKKNVLKLKIGGVLIVNDDNFSAEKLAKLNYSTEDFYTAASRQYQIIKVSANKTTKNLLSDVRMDFSKKMMMSNMVMLGVVYWLTKVSILAVENYLKSRFKKHAEQNMHNLMLLKAGYNFGIINEISCNFNIRVSEKTCESDKSFLNGNEALALSFITVSQEFNARLFVAGYPITPASSFMDNIWKNRSHTTSVIQAEDEIAAAGMTLGAAYAGSIAVTCTSGPGLDLTMETLGLAVMVELPMILLNIQRSGPSTGIPTKTEQTDLLAVCFGRHGECPLPVLGVSNINDITNIVYIAVVIAFKYRTPVVIMSDAFIANNIEQSSDLLINKNFSKLNEVYDVDASKTENALIRGLDGTRRTISGLEVDDATKEISSDPLNHQKMVSHRQEKMSIIAGERDLFYFHGLENAKHIIISWGSNYDVVQNVMNELNQEGYSFSFIQLKLIYPLPDGIKKYMNFCEKVFVVEQNMGQLCMIIRSTYLVNAISICKVDGNSFCTNEVRDKILKEITND
jgi:2-oxoglutarate ferredoxin oxidoreductase subunit alpha